MLTFVLIANVLIGCACLGAAWQLWQLQFKLQGIVKTLDGLERKLHGALAGAPQGLAQGQGGVKALRSQYQQLQPKLAQFQQLLRLLVMGRQLWQGRWLVGIGSRKPRR